MKWTNRKCLAGLFSILLFATQARAQNVSFTNLLAQGELAGKNGDISTALRFYSQAKQLESSNAAHLCILTKNYCDLMYTTHSSDVQRNLARLALACALQAEKIDPKNETSHICVAICYAKNFPFANNQTRVNYSRLIKQESEKAIELDPKDDIAYYLLGRWNFGVANMSFFDKGLVKIIYGGLPAASDVEAIKNLKHAIRLNPNRIINRAELAEVYHAIGKNNLAKTELEKCRAMKPLDQDDEDAQAKVLAKLN